jgi:hypothetical protein
MFPDRKQTGFSVVSGTTSQRIRKKKKSVKFRDPLKGSFNLNLLYNKLESDVRRDEQTERLSTPRLDSMHMINHNRTRSSFMVNSH